MVKLLGPQNCKMEELLGVKFVQNGIFTKFSRRFRHRNQFWAFERYYTAHSSTYDNYFFFKFRHLRIFLEKQLIFRKKMIFGRPNTSKFIFLHFSPNFFLKNGRITWNSVKDGRASPPGHHPPFEISDGSIGLSAKCKRSLFAMNGVLSHFGREKSVFSNF